MTDTRFDIEDRRLGEVLDALTAYVENDADLNERGREEQRDAVNGVLNSLADMYRLRAMAIHVSIVDSQPDIICAFPSESMFISDQLEETRSKLTGERSRRMRYLNAP